MFNPFKYFKRRKVGLVLGSGGAKGLSHISVIEYIESMDIPIDMICGSSIGAVIGAVYCSGSLGKLKEDLLAMSRKEFLSLFDLTIPRSGLLKGNDFVDFMKKYIPENARLEEMPVPLSIVATDYYTGKTVIFTKGNVLNALRASISIPGIFIPVPYRNTFLMDGGVANPLPVDVIRMMGADLTIAVNLHPGLKISKIKNYVKSKIDRFGFSVMDGEYMVVENRANIDLPEEKKDKGWFNTVEQWLRLDHDNSVSYPSIFEILSQTIDIMEYVNTINTLRYNRPTVLIEPDLVETGTLDFDETYKILTEGYRACSRARKGLVRKIKFWL